MSQSMAGRVASGGSHPVPAGAPAPSPVAPARNPTELRESFARLAHRDPIRLDEALLALGAISPDQLEKARQAKAEDASLPFGVVLQRDGGVDEEAVHAGLAFQLGVPAVDLRGWRLDPAVLSRLPAAVARRYRALPVWLDGNVLYVAMSDVLNREVLDAMRVGTPLSVQPVYAPASDVQWMLDRYYLAGVTAPVSDEDLERDTEQYAGEVHAALSDPAAATDNVIVRLADQIIAEAHRERASDIHIEPMPERGKTLVRIRIDGRMFVRRSIPWVYRDALVSRYKVMANLNVAEHRTPQDGKILFRKPGAEPIELRVAVLPTAGGVEDIVLRILDTNAALPLTALGLSDPVQSRLRELIEKPYGILLVCGPTGSGKTTTLHAVLHHLNDGNRKIWTVENPVEITQPGLRQVQVNPAAGLTFATALRAFLRADPDVVMVGEIRDAETAKTALEASLTGHLVLSTLHTNNAPESVVRLLEMGMSPFNFSDSLLGILAQRLVRCLCRHCRQPIVASDDVLGRLAHEHGAGKPGDGGDEARIDGWRRTYGRDGHITLYQPRGCTECAGIGYRGRVGLFELLPATAEVKRLIIDGASATDLFELALQQGMQTLKQDGIAKVLSGVTDLSQVLAVSQR
jgi:type II secretory ATPase GspE/PulE/Tfp pilus assembly ATPase PilB-like protein